MPASESPRCKQRPDWRAAVRETARATAQTFAAEFAGEYLDGDWDSEAWSYDLPALEKSLNRELPPSAWAIYRASLDDEICRLADEFRETHVRAGEDDEGNLLWEPASRASASRSRRNQNRGARRSPA
jgi:hypothetical protein